MANYNRFGASYATLLELYHGLVAADFSDQATIENMMDMVETEMYQHFNQYIKQAMIFCNGATVLTFATAGLTSITVTDFGGLKYSVTDDYEVWVNYGSRPEPPQKGTGLSAGNGAAFASAGSDQIGITLDDALSAGDNVILSCTIDPTNSNYQVNSLKDTLMYGVAAKIGTNIFAPDDSPLPKMYETFYQDALKRLKSYEEFVEAVPEFSDRNEIIYQGIVGKMITGTIGL